MNPDDVKLIEKRQCPECARLAHQNKLLVIEQAHEESVRSQLQEKIVHLDADLKAEAEHRLQCQNELFIVRSNLKAHCDAIEHLKQAKAELEAYLAESRKQVKELQGRLLKSEPDVIARYQGKDGSRDWASASAWLMPGQALAVVDL